MIEIVQARICYHNTWIVAYMIPRETWLDTRRYYLSLIPKCHEVKPQKYDPHVTVLRKDVEQIKPELFDKHVWNGVNVQVAYDTELKTGGKYWYLGAWSPDLMALRVMLGLPELRDGYMQMHITIGNTK